MSLEALAETLTGKPIANKALADAVDKIRDAQGKIAARYEDLAREIADDERRLREKYERLAAFAGEINDMAARFGGQ